MGALVQTVARPAQVRDLFVRSWGRLREELTRSRAGVLVAAVERSTGDIAATRALEVDDRRGSALIVGRHPQCDLGLFGDTSIAARHLVIAAYASKDASGSPVHRFRALDLRTASGFEDEGGRRLESMSSDGPAFLVVGRYLLIVLVADAAAAACEDAEEAWSRLPERIFISENAAGAPRRAAELERSSRRDRSSPVTLVCKHPAPRPLFEVRGGEGPLHGHLVIAASDKHGQPDRIPVDRGAAQCGVLVGREPRCDSFGNAQVSHRGVSGIHVLVIELEGQMIAIDAASTNGTFLAESGSMGERVRWTELTRTTELILGQGYMALRWEPVPSDRF